MKGDKRDEEKDEDQEVGNTEGKKLQRGSTKIIDSMEWNLIEVFVCFISLFLLFFLHLYYLLFRLCRRFLYQKKHSFTFIYAYYF